MGLELRARKNITNCQRCYPCAAHVLPMRCPCAAEVTEIRPKDTMNRLDFAGLSH